MGEQYQGPSDLVSLEAPSDKHVATMGRPCKRAKRQYGEDLSQRFDDDVAFMRTCDYCKCDLFNRAYQCTVCLASRIDGEDEKDLCQRCVSMGRTCHHGFASLVLRAFVPFSALYRVYQQAVAACNVYVKGNTKARHPAHPSSDVFMAKCVFN